MRKLFANFLYQKMEADKNVILLTGDLGYGLFDKIREDFPNQFWNFGSAELSMVSAACGMAKEKKIPYCYSITPFILWRPFEVIRNYIDKDKIPVKLVGGGRNKDYSYLGFSHWAEDDLLFMNNFKNINSYKPTNEEDLLESLEILHNSKLGAYINLIK